MFRFELLLKGDIILAEAKNEFNENLNNLKNTTVFGHQIEFNVTEMKQAYSQGRETNSCHMSILVTNYMHIRWNNEVRTCSKYNENESLSRFELKCQL